VLTRVQPAIRAEGDAVCTVGFLRPGGDPALEIDFHDPIVVCVGEIDGAVLVDCGVGRKLVSLPEQGPRLAGHEDLGGLRAEGENRNHRQERIGKQTAHDTAILASPDHTLPGRNPVICASVDDKS